MLKAIEPLGNALVIGEAKNYLVAVLAIDPEKLKDFGHKNALPTRADELLRSSAFQRYLAEHIEQDVNAKVSRFETIKKWEVLPHDFTIEGGELTSTLKVRRKFTETKYKSVIDRLYADDGPARA
jgi:long-chain acyl-CoA synthetase